MNSRYQLFASMVSCLPMMAAWCKADLTSLSNSLTMHASFDSAFTADFSRGDPTLYEFSNRAERNAGGRPSVPDEQLKTVANQGRFGGALMRAVARPGRLMYRGAGIVVPKQDAYSGTVSVWLQTTPNEDLPDAYCDPVMILADDFRKGALFVEWSRPPDRRFRYAIVPPNARWNPSARPWDEIPAAERPMVQPAATPFAREDWVHVAFMFDRINAGQSASGRLYLDGQLQGTISGWDLTFEWDPAKIILALGWSYAGGIDDLAVFDRALNTEEIAKLMALPGGVGDLHRPGHRVRK